MANDVESLLKCLFCRMLPLFCIFWHCFWQVYGSWYILVCGSLFRLPNFWRLEDLMMIEFVLLVFFSFRVGAFYVSFQKLLSTWSCENSPYVFFQKLYLFTCMFFSVGWANIEIHFLMIALPQLFSGVCWKTFLSDVHCEGDFARIRTWNFYQVSIIYFLSLCQY